MKPIIIGLVMAISCFSYSQNCNYTFLGELKDFHDGTPIESATIYIKESDTYLISDFDGKFKIENLCAGTLTLTISHANCETKTVSFEINSDTFKTILIEHHIEELMEVSVIAHVDKKETKTAQETVLKEHTLKKYSALSIGDALKEVAGVSSINTGSSIVKPMINGMHSSRLIMLNNNVRLQDQDWGIEHAPNIDVNAASQISVIKGAGALAYGGDAIGGVVVVNPDRVFLKDTLFGKTTLSGQSNGRGYSANTKLNKYTKKGWFASVQGSLKQNGDFETPDYVLTNTGSNSKGFTFRGGKQNFESGFEVFYSYLNNEIGILKASHIGNIEDLVSAINSLEPLVIEDFSYDINAPKQDVTHQLAKAMYYKRFNNFGKVNLQYDYQNNQRLEYDIRVGDDRDKAALDLKLQTHTLSSDIVLDALSDYKLKFGIMGRYQNNFANPDTGVRRLIPDYDKFDFGIYATTEHSLNSKMTLDFGLRYDFNRIDAKKFYFTSRWEERGYDEDFSDLIIDDLGTQLLVNPVFDYHNFSTSAGFNYQLNEHHSFIGNYSLSSRPPNPSELFSDGLHHSAARIELGDLRLTKETSNRVSASYIYNSKQFNLTTEAFYNHINDYMYIEPTGIEQTIRGAFPVWQYLQTNAELYGIDLSVNYTINEHFNFSNKTSYTVGNDIENDRSLINIPAFNTRNSITYTNDWKQFSASLTSDWTFEQTKYPDNNFETYIASTNETVLVDISTPPSAYQLLNFYSEVTLETSDKTNLNIALSVNNLLDTNYRAYLNRLRYFADDMGRNIMLQLQYNY
ncbi:Outer membrane hemin receptor [Winogradskyella psychrotolerans RS-3]|uniref:Outer membrane hemin receptor n=1 Tax=Winogradskyella psychrotolerans RS-3 TaxID=641526 RepID=S7WSQ1_9FLAO|nr:TonB-dependent receptor [Winogradskyella psychrotolerans]EPR69764.1 Outer membrane hemin receptor [Winogradskyella psychrotolerans RS-3]